MYGIKTAASSGLPTEVIHEAERIYKKLQSDRELAENSGDQGPSSNNGSRINRNLLHHLYVLRYADLDDSGKKVLQMMSTIHGLVI
jgi:DNA mismatch repair ATPase MutS